MKIVVIGGSGLIGARLVALLSKAGHEVLAASPRNGVNTVTGEGLSHALMGADVVVDVTNAPSWEPQAVLDFFRTSARNLGKAEVAAGVHHHIALSIVGCDRTSENAYFTAKVAQEEAIESAGVPYTDRARDSVHGVHRRHRGFQHGRRYGAHRRRTVSADRRRRRRGDSRADRARGAAEWHGRYCWPRP
jgi:uncharacterized protein YbjT (DUF2867 family)